MKNLIKNPEEKKSFKDSLTLKLEKLDYNMQKKLFIDNYGEGSFVPSPAKTKDIGRLVSYFSILLIEKSMGKYDKSYQNIRSQWAKEIGKNILNGSLNSQSEIYMALERLENEEANNQVMARNS